MNRIKVLSHNEIKDFNDRAHTWGEVLNPNSFNYCIQDVPGMRDKCAAYVRDLSHTVSGINPEMTGIYGNAWTMQQNIEDRGGVPLFNIFTSPEFKNAKNMSSEQFRSSVFDKYESTAPMYSMLQKGDVVGITIPSSRYQKRAILRGNTYNSHVGIVTDIQNGVPIITHTVNGVNYSQPITDFSEKNGTMVTNAIRPSYRSGRLSFTNATPTYKVPFDKTDSNKEDYNNMYDYMASLASSKSMFEKMYPNVDWNMLEKAAIGILKRETNYMRTKGSDVQNGEAGLLNWAKGAVRDAVHWYKETPEYDLSGDLTKMKFRTLPKEYRDAIGLYSKKQLDNDPTVTARAVLLYLGKAYDYYDRLAKKYPKLGITKEDMLNASIWAYNEGIKWHLGFDPETGTVAPGELELLRIISDKNYRTKNYKDTNYKHLGRFGKWLYQINPLEKDYPGYVANAKLAMENLIPINKPLGQPLVIVEEPQVVGVDDGSGWTFGTGRRRWKGNKR